MSNLLDLCRFYSTTTGASTSPSVGAHVPGFCTPAEAGAVNGATYSFTVFDPATPAWGKGTCVYNSAGPSLTLTYVTSSNSNAAISLTGNEIFNLTALAADIVNKAGDTMKGAFNGAPTVTLASAGTVNIGAAAANYISVTGTTTITAFDSIAAGAVRAVEFAGALTLTHNATSLILPGAANITTAAGDVAEFTSEGSGNWRCTSYTKASGQAVVAAAAGMVLLNTLTASASSSLSDTTSITSTYKAYLIIVRSLVLSTNSKQQIQFSTNAGSSWLTTGYKSPSAVSTYVGFSTTAGLSAEWSPSGTGAWSGSFTFTNPNSGIAYGASLFGTGYYSDSSGTFGGQGLVVFSANSTASAINGILFQPTSGNYTSGTIEIWGIP